MKRYLLLTVITISLFALSACGKDEQSSSGVEETTDVSDNGIEYVVDEKIKDMFFHRRTTSKQFRKQFLTFMRSRKKTSLVMKDMQFYLNRVYMIHHWK